MIDLAAGFMYGIAIAGLIGFLIVTVTALGYEAHDRIRGLNTLPSHLTRGDLTADWADDWHTTWTEETA